MFSVAFAQEADEYFQEETGLPGDHLSLSAVLEVFKESKSMEAFESALNTKDQKVNNLDINDDGQTDYIRVQDFVEDDVHAIVLQVPLADKQSQDIAVIEIEKTGSGSAVLQIIGDEDIYGEQWIVEPYEEEDNGKGPSFDARVRLVVNVWAWPSVRFIYRPSYIAWVSPWRYRHYPRWWRPWRPITWGTYHMHHRHHRIHFHVAPIHRVHRAHHIYVPRRTVSTRIQKRHHAKVVSYRAKPKVAARTSVSKTRTIQRTGPAGGTVTTSKTTKVGVAKGANGQKVVGKRTTKSVSAEGSGGRRVDAQKKQVKVAGSKDGKVAAGKRNQVRKAHTGPQGGQVVAKKSSAKTVKANGDRRVASKSKSKSVKAKGKNGARGARKTTSKKTVKRRKNRKS